MSRIQTVFCSIVLNEEEYFERNLRQHIDFCDRWIIIEGAVTQFPRDRVTADGLSTDKTAQLIRDFPDPEHKIQFIQAGWQPDKETLRSKYAEQVPDETRTMIVFDGDEFLRRRDLAHILQRLGVWHWPGCWRIPHVHFWKTPRQVITGGYYDIPHNRIYRWAPGCRYRRNHNHPEDPRGVYLHDHFLANDERNLQRLQNGVHHPDIAWFHYGFCKSPENMRDKTDYYLNRGEATTRPETTASRAAWFQETLPQGCQVQPWLGDWPEVFYR